MEATLEMALESWDGETVVVHRDHPSGAWIVIALHSTLLGPAAGGTRVKSYPALAAAARDAQRLAAGMTYKLALSGLDYGGGKAVIALPADFDATDHAGRDALLRRYGALVKQLGGLFVTGPDVGTSAKDMDVIAASGAPYIFGRTPAAGGSGDSGPPTAVGVLSGMRVTCARLFGDDALAGRRVLVQGAGSVGGPLIALLRGAGAEVLFSEVDEALTRHLRDELGLPSVPESDVYATECDVLAPCALGGILNAETIPRLRCRAVVGSANNQLATPEDAERLHARNILYAPDFAVNVGGAMALLGRELLAWSADETERRIAATVTHVLRGVFARASDDGISTNAAAQALAERRLAVARAGSASARTEGAECDAHDL
jgi:glutamate dehydrogenase/leucine dehydrogenase